jgi:hypothetical protein
MPSYYVVVPYLNYWCNDLPHLPLDQCLVLLTNKNGIGSCIYSVPCNNSYSPICESVCLNYQKPIFLFKLKVFSFKSSVISFNGTMSMFLRKKYNDLPDSQSMSMMKFKGNKQSNVCTKFKIFKFLTIELF